jgi:hypothetical protein
VVVRPGVIRRLVASLLVLGIALAIAPDDAPTRDHARIGAPSPAFALGFIDWTIDAPDFVEPEQILLPVPRIEARVIDTWTAPSVRLRAHDVLRDAPKTSPPA